MMIRRSLFLWIFFFIFQSLAALPLAEQFKQLGYAEICDEHHGAATFDALYASFDECIEFLQKNPAWIQKLYSAKERFIRSKERYLYSTDFFGLYDESKRKERGQIAFYYAPHFHVCVCSYCPEIKAIPEIMRFLEICSEIQESYSHLFKEAASQLGVETIFSGNNGDVPLLFKVVKYLPSYVATRPHYDGSAFSLFLDSTDNQSLLLAPYKSFFTVDDFASPVRKFSQEKNRNSVVLIPGALLAEFSIFPTPHIVAQSGNIRYATVAFAMRSNYVPQKNDFSLLPNFKTIE